jgi:hypothetical protein
LEVVDLVLLLLEIALRDQVVTLVQRVVIQNFTYLLHHIRERIFSVAPVVEEEVVVIPVLILFQLLVRVVVEVEDLLFLLMMVVLL